MTMRPPIRWSTIGALLLAASLVPAYAAEHVYLRSGADLVCDHRQNMADQVRLYLTPSADDYLDVAASEIVRTEAVIEPPSPIVQPAESLLPADRPLDLPALLHEAGAQHHIDPDLLASVVRAESGGKPRVVSHAGARGLMQLMPRTASELGVQNSFAPEQNVAGGTAYLDALLMYYHDNVALALAAYNAGPAAVARYHGIPPYPETRRYVQRIIHDYNRRKLLEAKRPATAKPLLTTIAATTATGQGKLSSR